MTVTENIMLIATLILCYESIKSDITSGIIRNSTLIIFGIFALGTDIIYYGIFAHDLLRSFLLNLCIMVFISLVLFYTHCFAGGDCKLIIVLAAIYPARYYLMYNDTIATLFLAIVIAILYGYFYLLFSSIWSIIKRQSYFSLKYLANTLSDFVKSYLSAMIYISAANCFYTVANIKGFHSNNWISYLLCMAISMCVGHFSVLRKRRIIIPLLVLVIIYSVITRSMPISLNPSNYILVLILMLFQIAIQSNLYEQVKIENLTSGMILSTASSMMMQTSITKGLPGLSTEDLKSRLSASEIESIKTWAKEVNVKNLYVVKKIPFAIFIAIGFITYYILWRTAI